MKLRIVGHPAQRMRERGVTEEDIVHALLNHHSSWPTRSGDAMQYVGPGVDGRDLKVWLLQPGLQGDEDTSTVKSVAWKGEES